jgi:hypothetical protein
MAENLLSKLQIKIGSVSKMKDYSASQIKKGVKTSINQFPKDGSRVREMFDLFHNYKGQIIDFGIHENNRKECTRTGNIIKYLYTFYGMDLAHVGKHKWRFCGEYVGRTYVSYVNDQPLRIKVKNKG